MPGDYSRREVLRWGAAAGLAFACGGTKMEAQTPTETPLPADLILLHGRLATLDERRPLTSAAAIRDGRFVAVGTAAEVMAYRADKTRVLDLGGRPVIPGRNDSHMHPLRGGLNDKLELRWDGVPSLADALRLLREPAQRPPPPQWVRVVGGRTECQVAERRLPTLDEMHAVAPDTPVCVLHLYDRALVNGAALRAVGSTKGTPDPPGGDIQRDTHGNPTGLRIAKPNAMMLYATLAKGPTRSPDDQRNSTRRFLRELNRFGVTSAIDAGGGFQHDPEDDDVVAALHQQGALTVRLAYNLCTPKPRQALAAFQRWTQMTRPGAGAMPVFSAADFEDVLEPRPGLPPVMDTALRAVSRHLVAHRWPFRLHATHDETITRALNVYEEVNRDMPWAGLHWFFAHGETISDRNIERIKALGGGIAVHNRLAFQGEPVVERAGAQPAQRTPPIRRMLERGVPVGAGTDGTRVSSDHPCVARYWLITGHTVGGLPLSPARNRLDRLEALRLYPVGSAWFSGEAGTTGAMGPGHLADLAVLSADYLAIPEEEVTRLESVWTIVGGHVVDATAAFARLAPPPLPASPDWSPVQHDGGSASTRAARAPGSKGNRRAQAPAPRADRGHRWVMGPAGAWPLGCDCFAL